MKFELRLAQATVVIGLATALVIIWLSNNFISYPTPDNLPTRWDHYRYIAISRYFPFTSVDPLAREAPYCWRILTPFLVYFSPLNWPLSFMLLTLAGMGGAALTLYAYLEGLGYNFKARLFGLGIFFSLSGIVFNLRDFYLVDPLALFAIALGFYFLLTLRIKKSASNPVGKPSPGDIFNRGENSSIVLKLLVILVLGVLAKETVFALLPLILFNPFLGRRDKILLCLVPLLTVGGLRLFYPSFNDYNYFNEITDVVEHNFLSGGVIGFLMRVNFAFLGTWGPALVLVCFRPRDTLQYLISRKAELVFLAIIYAQIVIAHNVDRLLVYGFMIIIPLLVHKAVLLERRFKLNIFALLVFLMGLQLGYFYGRPPFWASLIICTAIAIWLVQPFGFISSLLTFNLNTTRSKKL